MSRSSNIFAGLLGSFAVSVYAMVLVPQNQLGSLQPSFTEEEGKYSDIYPVENGAADQGRAVYVQEGCVVCHSQQVRDPQNGIDLERGWGARRTVARDYLFERPALLGSSRLGPDLANVGSAEWRNEPKGDTRRPVVRDAAWHYVHLFNPRQIITESNHPPYRYLFNEVPITGQKSTEALMVKGPRAPKAGFQVVPTPAAKNLVAYLLTLDRSHSLKEAAGSASAPAAAAPVPPANAAK